MASDLTPITIAAPGFFGLNTQDSPIGLPPEYALTAQNCVIDKLGRVGARKGWTKYSDYDAGIGTDAVTLIHELINTNGTVYTLFIANGKIWELNISTGAVTAVYTGAWTNAGTTAGDSNWKAVTFNGYAWFFKRGENPIVVTPGSPCTGQLMSAMGGYAGTVPTANEVLSAYGRLWAVDTATDKVTINWSDTLIGQAWTGGASGSLSIEKVSTNGTRPVVALAAFNGYLVIFCDTAIIVYEGADVTPATSLALVEVIDGVGCISRDSIQDIGSDILFLSSTGVRSLGRIIAEKSAPLYDVSRNIRDELLAELSLNGDNEAIKSCYNDQEGFYLLTLLNQGITYCLDIKNRLENNACRVTSWTLAPYCWFQTYDKYMFLGGDGYVGLYNGYYDNDINTYRMIYKTSWLSGEQANALKILKNLKIITVDGSGLRVDFGWGVDYTGISRFLSRTIGIKPEQGQYNVSEFNEADFGTVSFVNKTKIPLSGYGQVFQIEIITSISGEALSIQQLDIFTKLGRLT